MNEIVEDRAEQLMREFYLSASYSPKAERPADNVKAAIAFAITAHETAMAERVRELEAENARLSKVVCSGVLGQLLTEDESEALAAFVKQLRAATLANQSREKE